MTDCNTIKCSLVHNYAAYYETVFI